MQNNIQEVEQCLSKSMCLLSSSSVPGFACHKIFSPSLNGDEEDWIIKSVTDQKERGQGLNILDHEIKIQEHLKKKKEILKGMDVFIKKRVIFDSWSGSPELKICMWQWPCWKSLEVCRTSHDKETGIMHVCLFWSLSFLIKLPVFNLEGSTLMALSNPNHLPNALPLNTIVGFSFYLLNISQWGLSFNT